MKTRKTVENEKKSGKENESSPEICIEIEDTMELDESDSSHSSHSASVKPKKDPGKKKDATANDSSSSKKPTARKSLSSPGRKSPTKSTPSVSKPCSNNITKIITTAAPKAQNLITLNPPTVLNNAVNAPLSNVAFPQTNQLLINSFPTGQTFMSINNNLIPIGSPATPFVQPVNSGGIILTSPSPSFQPLIGLPHIPGNTGIRAVQSGVRISTPRNVTALALNSLPRGKAVAGSTAFIPSGVKPLASSTLGLNRFQSVITSPLLTSVVNPLVTPSGGRIISAPLLPGGVQMAPAHILSNIKATGDSSLPIIVSATSTAKPVISTTISNAVQVQKVTLPASKTSRDVQMPSSSKALKRSNLSEPFKVNTVASTTGSISSAPVINIPALLADAKASAVSPSPVQKPGTLFFESAGDLYMLEPVDDNQSDNSDVPVATPVATPLSVAPVATLSNAHVATPLSDASVTTPLSDASVTTPLSDASVTTPLSDAPVGNEEKGIILKEVATKPNDCQVKQEQKGEGKCISPRKVSEVKNGIQIQSFIQEKRNSKSADTEIMQKIKYYQLEMKFLASQAECKKLKLELMKALKKNKDDKDINSSRSLSKDEQSGHESEKVEESQSASKYSNSDNHEMNQCDTPKDDSEVGNETAAGQVNDMQPMDTEDLTEKSDVDSSKADEQLKGDPDAHSDRTNNRNSPASNLVRDEKSTETPSFNASDKDEQMDAAEKLDDEACSDPVDMGTHSCEDNDTLNTQLLEESSQCTDAEVSVNEETEKTAGFASVPEDVGGTESPKETLVTDNSSRVIDVKSTDNDPESEDDELFARSNEMLSFEETLKRLETQYGAKKASDVYTMIRSSVLQGLYKQMLDVSDKNKKLVEKLQTRKS